MKRFSLRKSVPFVLRDLNSSNHCGLEFYAWEGTNINSFSHNTQQVSWENKISSGDLQRVMPLEWDIHEISTCTKLNETRGLSHCGLAILHEKVTRGKRRIIKTQIFHHAKTI
jgi:hypothetical protein